MEGKNEVAMDQQLVTVKGDQSKEGTKCTVSVQGHSHSICIKSVERTCALICRPVISMFSFVTVINKNNERESYTVLLQIVEAANFLHMRNKQHKQPVDNVFRGVHCPSLVTLATSVEPNPPNFPTRFRFHRWSGSPAGSPSLSQTV